MGAKIRRFVWNWIRSSWVCQLLFHALLAVLTVHPELAHYVLTRPSTQRFLRREPRTPRARSCTPVHPVLFLVGRGEASAALVARLDHRDAPRGRRAVHVASRARRAGGAAAAAARAGGLLARRRRSCARVLACLGQTDVALAHARARRGRARRARARSDGAGARRLLAAERARAPARIARARAPAPAARGRPRAGAPRVRARRGSRT